MKQHPILNFEQLSQVEREESIRRMSLDFSVAKREIKRIEQLTEENPKLDEEIFFYVFLPYFANTPEVQHYFKDDEHQTAHEKAMLAWQHVLRGGERFESNEQMVANWMYREVDVVRKDGTVAVTVPPLTQFNHIDTLRKNPDRIDVYAVVHRSNVQNRISTRHGEMALRAGLDAAAKGIVNDEAILKNIQRWNEVFAHYGFPTIKFKDQIEAATAEASDTAPTAAAAATTYNLNDFEDD